MRQGQQHRRGRGRNNNNNNSSHNNNNNRRGHNPLARSFESNGPDVKVRGTPADIAAKYLSLARDAQSTGDPVLAENYFQHAEHYNRIIMAYRDQQQAPQDGANGNPQRFRQDGQSMSDGGDDFDDNDQSEDMGLGEQPPLPRAGQDQPRPAEANQHRQGEPRQHEGRPHDEGGRPPRPHDQQQRFNRPERGGEQRFQRPDRDRNERFDRGDRSDRPDRGYRQDRGERHSNGNGHSRDYERPHQPDAAPQDRPHERPQDRPQDRSHDRPQERVAGERPYQPERPPVERAAPVERAPPAERATPVERLPDEREPRHEARPEARPEVRPEPRPEPRVARVRPPVIDEQPVAVVPPAPEAAAVAPRAEGGPRRRERYGLGNDQPEFLRRPVRRPRRDPDAPPAGTVPTLPEEPPTQD